MKPYPVIDDKTAEDVASPWLDVLKRQECAIVVFPPKGDAHRRIEHILGWDSLLKKYLGSDFHQYVLLSDSMYPMVGKSSEEVLSHLLAMAGVRKIPGILNCITFTKALNPLLKTKKSVTYFLYDTDEWFKTLDRKILVTLSQISEKQPRIQFLLFCRIDVASTNLLKLNLGTTTLIQNYFVVPLYHKNVIFHLIGEFARYWNVNIEDDIRTQLIEKIGCHTWLIKEGVRLYIKDRNILPDYAMAPTIRLRLEVIWQELSAQEQAVLSKIAHSHQQFELYEKRSLKFLNEIRLVEKSGDSYRITLPPLAVFVLEKQQNKTLTLEKNGAITMDEHHVTHRFGKNEYQALAVLLEKPGAIVLREELGARVWKDQDDIYTDWALDRLISRVRKKISALGINPQKIQTAKKAGWVWQP